MEVYLVLKRGQSNPRFQDLCVTDTVTSKTGLAFYCSIVVVRRYTVALLANRTLEIPRRQSFKQD